MALSRDSTTIPMLCMTGSFPELIIDDSCGSVDRRSLLREFAHIHEEHLPDVPVEIVEASRVHEGKFLGGPCFGGTLGDGLLVNGLHGFPAVGGKSNDRLGAFVGVGNGL